MAFPDAWLDELLAKNDIVSVISSYIELKPKGRRYWGLCPLHGEKTPSFSVNADKQLYYCFGCHAGGNVIRFLMDMDHLTFREAVEKLAQRAGMQMPEFEEDGETLRQRAYRERLYAVNRAAARYFMETLLGPDGGPGRAYFHKRGITADSVKRFGLGYAKEGWSNLKEHLTAQGFSEKEMLDAGLLVHNERKGTVYDAYRGRVIYPILDINGRVLGFGARTLTDEKPKYINTGDTPVYNKRNNLYGLNMQKGQRIEYLIMVEGYMDVIGLYEQGVTNAVASLGTALTMQQAKLLKRYVNTCYIAYDGDSAGQNAMIRGLDILRDAGIDVRVIVFPDGLDPDEFIRQRGSDAFGKLRDRALSLNEFKLESMSRAYDLANENDRERFVKQACGFIAGLEPVERERHYKQLAQKTGFAVEILREQANAAPAVTEQPQPMRRPVRYYPKPGGELTGRIKAEAVLCANMALSKDAALAAVQAGALELIRTPALNAYAFAVVAAWAEDETPNDARILASLSEEDGKLVTRALEYDPVRGNDPGKAAAECAERLRVLTLDEKIDALKLELNDSTKTTEDKTRLMAEINTLTAQKKKRNG
ncbi:MAG: DNA primase [Clostridia bacterium]|nr:DNA primase [Clostridia bacterium]